MTEIPSSQPPRSDTVAKQATTRLAATQTSTEAIDDNFPKALCHSVVVSIKHLGKPCRQHALRVDLPGLRRNAPRIVYTLYTSSTGAAEQDLHKCVLSDRESLMLRTTSTKLFLQSPQFCAIRHVSRCQTRNAGCVVHAWALTKPAPCTLHKTGQVPYAIRMAMACVSYGSLCPAAQQGRSYPSGPEATLGCTPDQS